jgi:hypothetical protein
VILMLASERPGNAIWWIAGWALSTFVTGILVVLVIGEIDPPGSRSNSTTACVLQVVLGALLALAAARLWSRRPARTGLEPKEPGWIARIGTMRPLVAFGLGAFWINAALVVAAGVDALRADLGTTEAVTICLVFAIASSAAQVAIVAYTRLRPAAATERLQDMRHWITANQYALTAGVALALSIWFVAQGAAGLAA